MNRMRKLLPNGYSLYWKNNGVGGRTYYSDEISGVMVWDTTTVDKTTLLEAILQEERLERKEAMKKYKKEHKK